MSISIAMVALGDNPEISEEAIKADLAAMWPDLPPAESFVEDVDEEGETPAAEDGTVASFQIEDARVFLAMVQAPIPWEEIEGPCLTSWLWPESEVEMKKMTNHCIVIVMADWEPMKRISLLTQVTSSVAETCPQTLGIYWGDSAMVISPQIFREFATLLPEDWPIFVWIDYRVSVNEEGKTCGFTTGMSAFDMMEIETNNASDPPGEFRERLIGLVCYLLENGPVIEDGNIVGEDENERIKVRYDDSEFGIEGKVMRLDYEYLGEEESSN